MRNRVSSSESEIVLPRRYPIAGIRISAATYASATGAIMAAAQGKQAMLVAATSVHGVTLGVRDPAFGRQLDSFDILTPDGQPLRWGLRLLHHVRLRERVYGPTLMLHVCRAAAEQGVGVYLYGARPAVLAELVERLPKLIAKLKVAGYRSPPFRELSPQEDADDVEDMRASRAGIVLVGLGCPRQERWAFAHRDRLPMAVVCVGAAFDFHAGAVRQAPSWMQARGLEWLFRVIVEPRRLWRRYATIVPFYLFLLGREYAAQQLRRRR